MARARKLVSMTSGQPVIEAHGLTKVFGDQAVVHDLTFSVPQGQIFGFVGPSGSGKTTTIQLLLGLYPPTAGEVYVLGVPPAEFTKRMRRRIGYMPQAFALYPDLGVRQNLVFAGRIYGMGFGRHRRMNDLLDFVELREHKHKLARNISGGMQRRLSLAATLLHDPELIFLDEPTSGVDPVLRRKFWDRFKLLQHDGRTLFITTQYVSEMENCDLVGLMLEGGLIAVNSPAGLRRMAYGGDIVDVQAGEDLNRATLDELGALPMVQKRVRSLGPRGARLVVDDAKTAIPDLMEWSQARGIAIESIEQQSAAFDDVFVELIRRKTTGPVAYERALHLRTPDSGPPVNPRASDGP